VNVVDSSAWLEFFADGPNASHFAKPIADLANLIVPTISIFEVFKRVAQQRDDDAAFQAIAAMEQGRVMDLDKATALEAARLSIELKLPLADSVILATARRNTATLWTQDSDFESLPGVRYYARATAN
jgi:predicted nucleic acid-binding protein